VATPSCAATPANGGGSLVLQFGVLPLARRLKPRATRCEAGLRRRIQAAAAAFARQSRGLQPHGGRGFRTPCRCEVQR
jgi:hypothetical protein